MILLKKEVSLKTGASLNREIKELIKRKKRIICKALNKRPVFLDKYLDAVNNRRDRTHRKKRFIPAIELIAQVVENDLISKKKTHNGFSYGFKGITPHGIMVNIHIREEIEKGKKDKRLFLITTF